MTSKRPKIKSTLQRIREQRELSRRSVAEALKTSINVVEKIEHSERKPTSKQVSLLAQFYGVPDFVLFSESVPNLEQVLPDFRTEGNLPFKDSPKGLAAIFRKSAEAEILSALSSELGQVPSRSISARQFSLKELTKSADEIRESLGFTSSKIRSKEEVTATLRKLRSNYEKEGIFTFAVNVPAEDYRGVYKEIDKNWSLILINKRLFSDKARLFTLAHEFAHHLIRANGVSNPLITNNTIERECNRFASRLLAPEKLVNELFNQYYKRSNDYTEVVRRISNESLLSNSAAAYRLIEMGLMPSSKFFQWKTDSGLKYPDNEQEDHEVIASDKSGGQWHYNVVSDYGLSPISIIAKSLQKNFIDRTDAERFLNARNETFDAVISTAISRGTIENREIV